MSWLSKIRITSNRYRRIINAREVIIEKRLRACGNRLRWWDRRDQEKCRGAKRYRRQRGIGYLLAQTSIRTGPPQRLPSSPRVIFPVSINAAIVFSNCLISALWGRLSFILSSHFQTLFYLFRTFFKDLSFLNSPTAADHEKIFIEIDYRARKKIIS